MTDLVSVDVAEGVMTVRLKRADKKNALTAAMYGTLADALDRAETDAAVKVVLFEAEGDSFCAGNDIADFMDAVNSTDPLPSTRYIQALAKASKPLVAAVQGNAVGIGATMLLHCDLVYLADNARLITPFVNLGIVPEAGSSMLIPSRIGHVRAFAMFALGEPVDAATALSFGLANSVHPVGEQVDAARKAAGKLTKTAWSALVETKRLMRDSGRISAVAAKESEILERRVRSVNAREALTAFTERRAPVFTDD